MLLIFLQHLIHIKMEAHVLIICLINAEFLVFQLKNYKKEVFEIILLYSKNSFLYVLYFISIIYKNVKFGCYY